MYYMHVNSSCTKHAGMQKKYCYLLVYFHLQRHIPCFFRGPGFSSTSPDMISSICTTTRHRASRTETPLSLLQLNLTIDDSSQEASQVINQSSWSAREAYSIPALKATTSTARENLILSDSVSACTFGCGCLHLGDRRSTREAQKSPVWALHCSVSMGMPHTCEGVGNELKQTSPQNMVLIN